MKQAIEIILRKVQNLSMSIEEALGNKMEVSNALHNRMESMYKSIIGENEG